MLRVLSASDLANFKLTLALGLDFSIGRGSVVRHDDSSDVDDERLSIDATNAIIVDDSGGVCHLWGIPEVPPL